MTVVGVDAGGTHTRALVVDAAGGVHGHATAGPGNPASGRENAARQIADACLTAAAGSQPELVAVAMAGVSAVGGDLPELRRALSEAGWTCPVVLRADLVGAWFSGTTQADGAVLIAGTGAVGGVVRDGELVDLVDGSGWLLGDEGAGFWLGRQVVRHVLAAIDGRGPETSLTELLLREVEVTEADRALPGDARRVAVIRSCLAGRPVDLARFAPLAFIPDDPVAGVIVAEAASCLLTTTEALLAKVPEEAPVVLGGSIVNLDSPIRRALEGRLGQRARFASDGLTGAAVLALRLAGHGPDETVREAIDRGRRGRP